MAAERDMLRLDGQVAVVTGASSGIGAGAAEALAEAGAAVLVNYHSDRDGAEKTLKAVREAGSRGFVMKGDVASEADVIALFDAAEKELGPVDIVFSNAGIQKDAAFTDMTLDDWNTVISLNLTGGFLCSREAVRRFRKKGRREEISRSLGKIVFNSSVHEVIPWAGHANYAAAKGGISLLMQTLAQEVAHEGIRVNSVAPGAIATAINEEERRKGEKEMLKLIPYGRIGDPLDVGRAVAWLASDAADYVVGHSLFADGGMRLYPGFIGNG
ncbi:glucose 1-dehydrogenase [Faunimonas pinastri]|uniref:Glucose 1-dehydrogenase n=1 Tax=Faunimonas pinastri TaxID=1855383 RepID=A0A1H9A017_9HYPH|nr:SDR family oxidoreductase [Faunimonas pinastri]SEP70020.1 glucose 1-dehydrogenase [Faunimonas pinastri]